MEVDGIVRLGAASDEVSDEELVARAQNGDDSSLQALFRRYRGRAKAKARSYFLMGADREDVIQESLIGLFKAVRDFKPDQEVSFRSFAELCMRSQVITAIKGATRHKHSPLNLSMSIFGRSHDDEEHTSILDRRDMEEHRDDPIHLVIGAEEESHLAGLLDELLSPLERQVIELLLDGKSYTEIASLLDRSIKSVDNAAQRIRHKLHRTIAQPKEIAIDPGVEAVS
jgi:RNA polymerase sporulation-specific sigma factor